MKNIALTIVLNGMPFIKQQADILPGVFDEWHIVEGASEPNHDTSWCSPIAPMFYNTTTGDRFGCSIDGTSEFLDELVKTRKNVFVHRKGSLWTSKTEMCNSIQHIMHDCILMQFDVDEIWQTSVLIDLLDYAGDAIGFDGMMFRCRYYVGPDLLITNENCYGNNPSEWRRLWKLGSATSWRTHEPPYIHGRVNYLTREFTEKRGWVFDHYAYTLESQLRFKENFYGYSGALNSWNALQSHTQFPCHLRDFLPWVTDGAIVDRI